jgi:nitrous oxidase accessory protein NosD
VKNSSTDFGIFALNSKLLQQDRDNRVTLADLQNTILGNTINARFAPISLMTVDNTHIADNILTYNSEGGVGLTVQRNSHINHIRYNQVIGNLTFPNAVRVPGPKSDQTGSNPELKAGAAMLMAQVNGPEPTLFNALIENTLYQLTATNSAVPNGEFTADNLVDGNTIALSWGKNDDGIVLAVAQRTIVRNNTFTGAAHGMRAGVQTEPRQFPGACSGNATRLCLSNDDCNIPGVDRGSQGTCTTPVPQPVDWLSDRSIMRNNRVLTPVNDGIDLTGQNSIIQGNTITGPGNANGAGIHLFGKCALETTIMTANTISNIPTALSLTKIFQQLTASRFGAQISLNSFTGYTTAVRTSNSTSNTVNPYDLPSELSVGQLGNYWGLMCPQGFDPTKVVDTNGQLNPNVVDSYPFGNSELTDRCS